MAEVLLPCEEATVKAAVNSAPGLGVEEGAAVGVTVGYSSRFGLLVGVGLMLVLLGLAFGKP